jgi:hypothetical protein
MNNEIDLYLEEGSGFARREKINIAQFILKWTRLLLDRLTWLSGSKRTVLQMGS